MVTSDAPGRVKPCESFMLNAQTISSRPAASSRAQAIGLDRRPGVGVREINGAGGADAVRELGGAVTGDIRLDPGPVAVVFADLLAPRADRQHAFEGLHAIERGR